MAQIKRPAGGTHCLCCHCGEIFGSSNGTCAQYCSTCKTADGRKAITEANEKIKKEQKN